MPLVQARRQYLVGEAISVEDMPAGEQIEGASERCRLTDLAFLRGHHSTRPARKTHRHIPGTKRTRLDQSCHPGFPALPGFAHALPLTAVTAAERQKIKLVREDVPMAQLPNVAANQIGGLCRFVHLRLEQINVFVVALQTLTDLLLYSPSAIDHWSANSTAKRERETTTKQQQQREYKSFAIIP